jgi:DDT domain/WSTF, HB1, Itc1p, MBD9 motif 1
VQPDGTLSAPFVRYFVSLDNRPLEEAVVDDNHIMRDRKIFTKQILRSFIKKTVTREAWTGAPWIVKPEVAAQYHIDSRVPPHLKYESKVAEKKQNQAMKKNGPGPDYDGMVGSFPGTGPPRLLDIKPAPKSHKSKAQQTNSTKLKQQPLSFIPVHNQPPQFVNPPAFQSHTFRANGVQLPQFNNFHNSSFNFAPLQAMPPVPPAPVLIKYPIEDLQIAPRKEGVLVRPPLKYFSQDTPVQVENHPAAGNGIRMESVGPLLETWDTLNVYCEVFKLDSFTFDDFVEAIRFTSEDIECELFVETHCAALKLLVESESEGGKVQIQLPEMDNESGEEESADDAIAVQTPTPEPEPKPKGRTTRSSLAKEEAANIKDDSNGNASAEVKKTHRAAEMQAENDWVERLKKRNFKNGGWEVIMVGLLHQLSKDPRYEKNCEELLQYLAPLDQDPTPATAKQQYATMDVNLRVKALQIVCMLTAETKAIRGFMEECSEQMTTFRKQKIQFQRDRKAA